MSTKYCAKDRAGAMVGPVAGGFIFIPAANMLLIWRQYEQGVIQYRDLRCWFAMQEMLARRCTMESRRLPMYTFDELGKLAGLSAKAAAASVARLEKGGLVVWSKTHLKFPRASTNDISELQFQNARRLVPVPRRTVRLLAQCGKPSVAASIVGHLLRCVYYRDGTVVSWGRCKSSWVADLFNITLRSAKASRRHLLNIGWLVEVDTTWSERQRWGGAYAVNLNWSRPMSYADRDHTTESRVSDFSPRSDDSSPQFSPPLKDREPLSRSKHQEPASARTAGVCKSKSEERDSAETPPHWKHLKRCDLTHTTRLLDVFEQACQAGEVKRSEFDRLNFVAAAEHAIVHGTSNPCGLFVKTIRLRRFHFLTQADEDAARARLQRQLFDVQRDRERRARAVKPTPVDLTHEQKLAQSIAHVCDQRKLFPMLVIRSMKLDWTSEKYASLLEEAELRRIERFQSSVTG
jgi:hypothetical protein